MLNTTILGRYEIIKQVRENELFVEYWGRDTQTGRDITAVAIRARLVSAAGFFSRFEPVTKKMANLKSKHASVWIESGEVEGQAVIVREHIDGLSLSGMLPAGGNGLPMDMVLDITQQLGEYLDLIHQLDLTQIGFDLEEVLLSPENPVQVTNFGIAQGLDIGGLLSANKIQTRSSYAPELLKGGQADARTDFYSLGAILFQALTGKELDPNFESADKTLMGEFFPSRMRIGISNEWDVLIARCLHPNPAKRIQSAAEFLNQVNEIRQAMMTVASDNPLGMEDSLVGQTLGSYRLVSRLGQGGMATVYKAYEPALDRYVAIKILPQFFAKDPVFVQRFRREAKAVAQLNHPNIVPIYSYGESGGITYIAMQFVVGDTLKHEGQKFSFNESLRLLSPIARALGYAHQRGIVHRDVKPSNILLADGTWPLLADFGLAQMAQVSGKLTESGVGMGTPMYMSPEQGQGEKVDHRTDIYSLGIVLYEMVTGDVPFRADTPMAIVIKHISAPMPMPRQVNPNIPEYLEAIILKATAKNPDDRYQTAEEMAIAMENALSRLPSDAPAAIAAQMKIQPAAEKSTLPESKTRGRVGAKPSTFKKTLWVGIFSIIGIIGACLLSVVLMSVFDICPPPGLWNMLPWCEGSPNQLLTSNGSGEVTSTPSDAPTPMVTNGNEVIPVEDQQSLCLDGHGSYMEIPYSESLDLPEALTLEAWVQASNFSADDCSPYGLCSLTPIINQGHNYSSAGNYTLFIAPQNMGFVFQPLDSKLMAPVESWKRWNHIAVTHIYGDGRESSLYLNGELLKGLQWTNDKGAVISGNDPFPYQVSPYYLGKMEPQGKYFSGCLDEVRIWDHARTQEEIQKTMRTELTGDEEGLAGYWKFNEAGDSTVAVDSSPNHNDGQLRGNAKLQRSDSPVSAPVLDNFESESPTGRSDWESYFEDNKDTTLDCYVEDSHELRDSNYLNFEFDVAENSWATCGFYFDSVQDWSRGEGIAFYLRSDQPNAEYQIELFGGTPDARTTYVDWTQTPPESVNGWARIEIPWNEILRADWEENPGAVFDPATVTGFVISISSNEGSRQSGTLWMDDLSLFGISPAASTQDSNLFFDDFENLDRTDLESYFLEGSDTETACSLDETIAYESAASLKFHFDAAPDAWASCNSSFTAVEDWSAGQGIAFYVHADEPGMLYEVTLFGGPLGADETYLYELTTTSESVNGWERVEIYWKDILRADWEDHAGTPINPASIKGFAFDVSAPKQARLTGVLWIDDFQVIP